MSFILGTGRQSRSMLGNGSFGWGPGRADFSGTSVIPPPGDAAQHFDLSSAETSLQKVAVWGCVNLTATTAETLPADVFRGTGRDKTSVPMPSWLSDLGGDGHGLADWVHQAIYSAMLRGNIFGRAVERDRTGQPRVLPLLHPDVVKLSRNEDGSPRWTAQGAEVDNMWHKRFNPVPGFALGLSPIASHVLTVGTALEVMKFGFEWFRDGAHPSSLLTNEENYLDEEQASKAKARWMGLLRRRREPAVFGKGWKWQQIQVAPNESQFLETHEYTSAECCRIFGPGYAEVFGYKTGGSLTYVNREERALDMLTYALDPWFVRAERLLSGLLPQPQYLKLNRAALLRTDLLTRYKAYNIAIASHFRVPSEVRDDEDWAPFTPAQEEEMGKLSPVTSAVPFDQQGTKA